MQSVVFKQTSTKFILRFSFHEKNFFKGKKTMVETISVAINDSSDVLWFDLYLINVFTKSTKAERCTDVMFKLTFYSLSVNVEDLNLYQRYRYKEILLGTCYFVLLNSTLGGR